MAEMLFTKEEEMKRRKYLLAILAAAVICGAIWHGILWLLNAKTGWHIGLAVIGFPTFFLSMSLLARPDTRLESDGRAENG